MWVVLAAPLAYIAALYAAVILAFLIRPRTPPGRSARKPKGEPPWRSRPQT